MSLRPTDSVAELRHRAALYQQGLMPQQQQVVMPVLMQPMHSMQMQMPVHMPMMAMHTGGASTAAAHAAMYTGGALPYSAAQAQQAALYHAFLQQQTSLQGQLRPHAPGPGAGEDSDSGCSTCSGRHDFSSRSPSRSRSHSRSRGFGRRRHSHRSYDPDDHADCISCTSSCSCTSGCDSEDEHQHEQGHGPRHGQQRDEGAQMRRGRRSSGVGGRRSSTGPAAASLSTASTNASARRSAKEEKNNGQQAQQQQQQQRRRSQTKQPSNADADMSARSGTEVQGAFAEEDEGLDATQLNLTESEIDATHVAPSPSPAHEPGSVSAAPMSSPAPASRLHVAFATPSRRRDLADSVQTAQRERVYESALSSITRAEQGFHSYVLSSAQAAETRPPPPNGSEEPAQPPPPPAGALLRKLLRFEPRGLRRPGEARPAAAPIAGALSHLGSGNLVYYDTVVTPSAAQRFQLSAAERAEVRRMAEWEHRADVGPLLGLGESERDLDPDAQDNPPDAPIFSAERYAMLLRQRKGVSLTLERKAGIIPVRRIRELRAGVVPGATRLVGAVNAHLGALNIAPEEMVVAEHCVSILLDRGMVARPRTPHGHANAYPTTTSGSSYHHDSHAAKHAACVAEFAPELCPRVSSSFGRASHTASAKLRREVARNQRKNLGTVASAAAAAAAAGADWSDSDDAMDDMHGDHSAGFTLGRHPSGSPSVSHSHPHGPAAPSWVVVATHSAEEAHTLINAIMFLKLLAGQNVTSKEAPVKEVVHLPFPGASPAPAPSPSPLRKKSKRESEPIAPDQLTDVLLTAAQHAAQAEAQMQAAHRSSASSAPPRTPKLKRKSVPTPSVHTTFAMPSIPARPSVRASLAASLTPVRGAGAKSSRPQGQAQAQVQASQSKGNSHNNNHNVAAQWAAAKTASQTPTPSKPAYKIAREAVEREGKEEHEQDEADDESAAAHVYATSQAVDATLPYAQHSPAGVAGAAASSGLTLSQLGGAHAVHDAALTVHASEPCAAVATWLHKKEAESERVRRRAQAAAARAAEERAAKQRESAAALERWQKKQAELAAAKEVAAAKQRAEDAAAQTEKESTRAARKDAAQKAYAAFLARANAKAEADSKKQRLSLQQAARQKREKKRLAQQRFEQWVQRKSDWFVGRVSSIKERQAERRRMGDGDMNEEDPEEEAALDWQWLEREVEAELQAASDAQRAKRNPGAKTTAASASKTARAGASPARARHASIATSPRATGSISGRGESSGVGSADVSVESASASLYNVLDEVDMALWNKLMRGIEATRDELDALRAAQRSAHGNEHAYGRALLEAERASDLSEGRGVAAYASGAPVIAVSLHSSPYERPEFSPHTADLYAYAQGPAGAPAPLFQRRPSPFAMDMDDAPRARGAQVRPDEYAGTYAAVGDYEERMQQAQQPSQPLYSSHGPDSSSLSRSASRARILSSPMRSGSSLGPSPSAQASPLMPPAAIPYESWLRAEMQAATQSDAPPHLTPGRFGSATPAASMRTGNGGGALAASPDVNLLRSAGGEQRPFSASRSFGPR